MGGKKYFFSPYLDVKLSETVKVPLEEKYSLARTRMKSI